MKFPELIPADFVWRPNRFVIVVKFDDGTVSSAHVPTTGRLTNALEPGSRVWLAPSDGPHRKTAFTLTLTELPHGGFCAVQAVQANRLFAEAAATGQLIAFDYEGVEAEVTIGKSRLDFRLSDDSAVCWVEIKSVTYAAEGVGRFPDAPTGRGRKHLRELAALAAAGDRASAVFIVQRGDARVFAPFEEVDPEFSAALREVHNLGVEVHAYRCKVTRKEIIINQEIPVRI